MATKQELQESYESLSGAVERACFEMDRLREVNRELLEALEHSKNRADEIFKAMIQFVGHAADCRYHGTDSPEGDVCVCRVESRIRELKHMLTRNTNECEAAIRKAKGE